MPKDHEHQHLTHLLRIEHTVDGLFSHTIAQLVHLAQQLNRSDTHPLSLRQQPRRLRQHIDHLIHQLRGGLQAAIIDGVRTSWALASEKNDNLLHRAIGRRLSHLTPSQREPYLSTNPEALRAFEQRRIDGLNLSQRVWRLSDNFRTEMEMALDIGLRDGLSADQLSRSVRQYLLHPKKLFRRVRDEHGQLHLSRAARAFHPGGGVYRSSYKNARRLAATEANIAYRTADHLRHQAFDFVVGIEVRLSNNHTCLGADGRPHRFHDICDELAGRYPKDFKFTGWHPHCRCHVITLLKTPDEMAADTERILQGQAPAPASQSVNSVKDAPQLTHWQAANAQRIQAAQQRGTLPYFIKDNPRYFGRGETLDALAPLDIKKAPLLAKGRTFTDKEVEQALMHFATTNPQLFRGGLRGVEIMEARDALGFMAIAREHDAKGFLKLSQGSTLLIANKDFSLGDGSTFNPYRELKAALTAIAARKPLTFQQEYALESLWHEFRHAAAKGWKNVMNRTEANSRTMEALNQFCARKSYAGFIQALGGKAIHVRKVMERGYGYSISVSNLRALFRAVGVSEKAAYAHFRDFITQRPYEDIHQELLEWLCKQEAKKKEGKMGREKLEKILANLCAPINLFQEGLTKGGK